MEPLSEEERAYESKRSVPYASQKAVKIAAGVECWLHLAISSLNFLWGNRKPYRIHGPISKVQLEAVHHLRQDVLSFRLIDEPIPAFKFDEFFRNHKISYTGEEVQVAKELTWAAVKPALPSPELCGRIEAPEIAVGGVKEFILNPDSNLLPRESWPELPKKAIVHRPDPEWEKLAEGLVEHNICEVIPLSHVFGWCDHHLLHGLFGVLKKRDDSGRA